MNPTEDPAADGYYEEDLDAENVDLSFLDDDEESGKADDAKK